MEQFDLLITDLLLGIARHCRAAAIADASRKRLNDHPGTGDLGPRLSTAFSLLSVTLRTTLFDENRLRFIRSRGYVAAARIVAPIIGV